MKKLKDRFLKAKKFVSADVWRINSKHLSKTHSLLIKLARVSILTIKGFINDKCILKASALTYYSLLSVVPVVATIFAIAKGFGLEELVERELQNNFSGQEQVLNYVMSFANSLLNNTKGGMIAGISVAVLFWTIMKVMSNIEHAFNDIWDVKQSRVFLRKFSDYFSILLIAPILIVLAGSINVFITTYLTSMVEKVSVLGLISPFIFFMLKFIPLGLIWILFSLIYLILPNTRVKISSAFLAALVAGTLYHLTQWVYINFQVGVAKYNAIYGSFAALPLLLVWLQTSWLIVLLGAEIAFSMQNASTYEFEVDSQKISHYHKRLITLLVLGSIARRFIAGKSALTANQISHISDIPIRLTHRVIEDLKECNIINMVFSDEFSGEAYQPAIDVNKLTLSFVVDKLDHNGVSNLHIAETEDYEKLRKVFTKFDKKIEEYGDSILIKDLA